MRGKMMIKFKINVLEELKNAGYSSYAIRQQKIFGQGTIALLRSNTIQKISLSTLETICSLLNCQPGDILEWVPDEE